MGGVTKIPGNVLVEIVNNIYLPLVRIHDPDTVLGDQRTIWGSKRGVGVARDLDLDGPDLGGADSA
ncbi:MAG: hypothetical protein ACRDQ5_19345 [Sciscionella sp.]